MTDLEALELFVNSNETISYMPIRSTSHLQAADVVLIENMGKYTARAEKRFWRALNASNRRLIVMLSCDEIKWCNIFKILDYTVIDHENVYIIDKDI